MGLLADLSLLGSPPIVAGFQRADARRFLPWRALSNGFSKASCWHAARDPVRPPYGAGANSQPESSSPSPGVRRKVFIHLIMSWFVSLSTRVCEAVNLRFLKLSL